MKKINKSISLATIVAAMTLAPLLVPVKAYADLGAPYTYSYDVIVTNPNGAKTEKCYGNTISEATIPAGTRLTIIYDYTDQNGEKTLDIGDGVYKACHIKASDADYAESTFDLSSVPKETPISKYTLNEESYLYKGPNERYGKNDDNYHLPAGVIVTSVYHDDVWMYVEYEGHAGWIYYRNIFQSNPKVANVASGEYFITTRNKLELKDTPSEDGNVVDSISVEPFTSIPVTYLFSPSKYTSWVYINYNQHSGWYYKNYFSQDVANDTGTYNKLGITTKDTKLAEIVDQEEGSYIVPANTELNAMYYVLGNQGYMPYRYYVKTTIDSTFIQGWVNADDLAFSPSSDSEKEKTYEYEQQLYDAMEGNPIDTVEAGTYRILYYDIIRGETSEDSTYWYYIGKKNTDGSYEKLGWIKSLKDDEIEEIAKKKEREIEAATTIEEPEVYTYPDEVEEEPGVNGQTKDALLWLIIGASVVSIIIIVSLVIAKKHKDSKNTQNGDGPKGDEPAKGEGEQKETKKEEVKTDNPELEDDAKEGDAKIEEDTKAEEDVEENNTEESTEVENEVEEDRPEENGTEEDTKVEEDSTEEDVGDDVEAGEDDSD